MQAIIFLADDHFFVNTTTNPQPIYLLPSFKCPVVFEVEFPAIGSGSYFSGQNESLGLTKHEEPTQIVISGHFLG